MCVANIFSHLPIIFLMLFNEKVLICITSNLPIFFFYVLCFLCHKKYLPTLWLWRCSPLFYSSSFIIVASLFKPIFHIKLILVVFHSDSITTCWRDFPFLTEFFCYVCCKLLHQTYVNVLLNSIFCTIHLFVSQLAWLMRLYSKSWSQYSMSFNFILIFQNFGYSLIFKFPNKLLSHTVYIWKRKLLRVWLRWEWIYKTFWM